MIEQNSASDCGAQLQSRYGKFATSATSKNKLPVDSQVWENTPQKSIIIILFLPLEMLLFLKIPRSILFL